MSIRLALFALALGLWSCGDDDDSAPTAAAVDSMIARADAMMATAQTMLATADSMLTAANAMVAADADSTVAADADSMLAAAQTMKANASSMLTAANAMVAADADSTVAADADSMLAAAHTMLAAADSMLAAAHSLRDPAETVVRPTGELKPWDLSSIVSADEVRSMPVGTPAFLRTEFAHGELADFAVKFVQVVDDFLAPMPIYMLEASDPVLIQLGGIAAGMSGSPIFTEQGTWGAAAYSFDGQDSPPYYFFATPIEWVIGTRGTVPVAKPAATWAGNRITPLEIPLLSTGLNGVHPLPEGKASILSQASSAGITQERQASFEAGRPLTVGLLLGEITLGSLGTVSYMDGNRVYGFGHPMSSAGPVELPIIEARVLGEISHWAAPFKYSTLNPTVRGTLTEDRLPAVRGVLGEEPELIPIKSVYAFPSGSELELAHRMAVSIGPYTSQALVSRAFFSPLLNRIDNDPEHSVRVATDISFVGTDSTLARSRLYSSPGGRLLASVYNAYDDVGFALGELMTRNDYALQVRSAEVHVEVIPETRFAIVAEVAADTVVSLGSTLAITTSLRVGRRNDQQVELALSVPDTLPPGFYQLEVGSAAVLGPDDWGFDQPNGWGFDGFEGAQTLDDVFARLNRPDENILLKARLTFFSPPEPEFFPEPPAGEGEEGEFAGEGEEGEFAGEGEEGELAGEGEEGEFAGEEPEDAFPPFAPPAPISTQEDVDLLLEGVQTLEIEVVGVEEEE